MAQPAAEADGLGNSSSKIAAADERSVEVVTGPPALDFSSLPVDSSELACVNGDEWDPHRVYFNEFLGNQRSEDAPSRRGIGEGNSRTDASKLGATTEALNTTGESDSSPTEPSAFRPFSTADEPDDSIPVMESVSNNPWSAVSEPITIEIDDDTLDPLGWPRQMPFHESQLDPESDRGFVNVEISYHEADGADDDDENLLGPSHRGLRSDYDNDASSDTPAGRGTGAGVGEEEEVALAKRNRLEQYSKIGVDEASLAANSSDGDDDGESDDDEKDVYGEGLEVGYCAQGDDEGDESDHNDEVRSEFAGVFLEVSSTAKSDDPCVVSERPTAFATFTPALTPNNADTQAFEVTWSDVEAEDGNPTDRELHQRHNFSPPPPSSSPSSQDVPARKPLPLLKPPPEEKAQKWLRGKGQYL
jgi:hypothetical protein